MEDFSGIINWKNLFEQSHNFTNNKPFKFAFIEDFFDSDFYEKLYQTYPKFDDTWIDTKVMSKTQLSKYWNKAGPNIPVDENDDPKFSSVWNKFKRYAQSQEFIDNFKKFSGAPVNKLKFFQFMSYKLGGFQFPHIHNVGPSTLVIMIYLSKNWKKGDPGGTYMASDEDESKIIFEPYNLDNSLAIFQDGPKAAHGVRLITQNVERKAIQITLEGYSSSTGWTG